MIDLEEKLSYTNYTFSLEDRTEFVLERTDVKNLKFLKNYGFGDHYLADTEGTVYKIKRFHKGKYVVHIMNPYVTKDGYVEYVLLNKKGGKSHIQGHRVVAGLFLKEIPGKPFVNHKDLDRTNNKLENLEYMSHSENVKHAWATNMNRKPRATKLEMMERKNNM